MKTHTECSFCSWWGVDITALLAHLAQIHRRSSANEYKG